MLWFINYTFNLHWDYTFLDNSKYITANVFSWSSETCWMKGGENRGRNLNTCCLSVALLFYLCWFLCSLYFPGYLGKGQPFLSSAKGVSTLTCYSSNQQECKAKSFSWFKKLHELKEIYCLRWLHKSVLWVSVFQNREDISALRSYLGKASVTEFWSLV